MIGNEYKNRAPEPCLFVETVEKCAEGVVGVGHAFVVAGKAVGQAVAPCVGYDEGVVR